MKVPRNSWIDSSRNLLLSYQRVIIRLCQDVLCRIGIPTESTNP